MQDFSEIKARDWETLTIEGLNGFISDFYEVEHKIKKWKWYSYCVPREVRRAKLASTNPYMVGHPRYRTRGKCSCGVVFFLLSNND